MFKWFIKFWSLAALFYWLDQSQWFAREVLAPLSMLSASATYYLLLLLGFGAQWSGTTLTTASSSFEIATSCTGSLVLLVYAAAVVSFPASWKARLQGLVVGFFAVSALNILRTTLIVLVASRFPHTFWSLHIIIGQVLVITGTSAVFFQWARHSGREGLPPLLQHHRGILKTLFLFTLGFIGGYGVYKIFLSSSLAEWTGRCVVAHSAWLLSWFMDASSQGLVLATPSHAVQLIPGCLSSPVVVVAMAIVFAWPAQWWKKGLILVAGSLPVYYVYHLIRTIFVFLSMAEGTKQDDFMYNFYGQVMLSAGCLFFSAYWWCSKKEETTYKRFIAHLVAAVLIALPIAFVSGLCARDAIIPSLLYRLKGSTELFYDTQQTISRMVDFHVFLWSALVGSTPVLSLKKRGYAIALGLSAVFVHLIGTVILFETFYLAPHLGVMKASVVGLPFIAYVLIFSSPSGNSSVTDESGAEPPPEGCKQPEG